MESYSTLHRFTSVPLASLTSKRQPASRPNSPCLCSSNSTNTSNSGGLYILAADKPRCSHITEGGFKCPNYSKHIYDGQELCNVHLGYVKAREPCTICLDNMTDSSNRCKLECGHYFHCSCLSKCPNHKCPQCRQPMAPKQAYKVFEGTKVQPLMERVFAASPDTFAEMMSLFEKVATIAERGHQWEIEYVKDLVDSYSFGLEVFDAAARTTQVDVGDTEDMMATACSMFTNSVLHVNEYGTFTGLSINGSCTHAYINSVGESLPHSPLPGGVVVWSGGADVGMDGSGVGMDGSGVGMVGSGLGMDGSGVGMDGSGVGMVGSGVGMEGSGVGMVGSGVGMVGSGVGMEGVMAEAEVSENVAMMINNAISYESTLGVIAARTAADIMDGPW